MDIEIKKYFYLLFPLVITLSACTINVPQEEMDVTSEMHPLISEKTPVFSEIKSLFEEVDNRNFDISFPIEIEGEDCYKVVVNGKLKSGKTYPIDIFVLSPNADKMYFLNKETDTYERFYTIPTFACKTSPDGNLRIESIGMDQDGPSGLHSLKEIRIINTSTGDVLWSGSSFLTNEFLWSEDSRFVATVYSGRQWTETDIVDIKDYSVIHIPGVEDILKVVPDISKPNDDAPLLVFKAANWLSSSIICIQFQWITNSDMIISGEYEYDIMNDKMNVKEIREESYG